MEKCSQEFRSLFSPAFEAAQDGILILDADTGNIKEVKSVFNAYAGYTREEFMDKKLWEVGAFVDIDKSKAGVPGLQTRGYVRMKICRFRLKMAGLSMWNLSAMYIAPARQSDPVVTSATLPSAGS